MCVGEGLGCKAGGLWSGALTSCVTAGKTLGLFDGRMAPSMWKPLCGRMLGMPGAEKGLEVKAGLSTQQKQFPAPHLEHSDPSALETDM